jgi:chemotaxis protein MotB
MKNSAEKNKLPLKSFQQVSFRKTSTKLSVPHKQPYTETGNEIWFLTLSDLLMLLMICFVLLFGITYKQQVSASVVQPQNIQYTEQASIPKGQKSVPISHNNSAVDENTSSLENDLLIILGNNPDQREVSIERHPQYIILTFPEKIIFDSGQAQLKSSAQPVLKKVAAFIQSHSALSVEIQGHTDDQSISSRRYPSNWELSADRATQVAKALMQFGINPTRLSTKGFGEYQPLYPNDSESNRLKNRRVELKFSLSESA